MEKIEKFSLYLKFERKREAKGRGKTGRKGKGGVEKGRDRMGRKIKI